MKPALLVNDATLWNREYKHSYLLVDGHLNKGNCFTVWGSQQSVLNDSALIASGLIGGTSNLIAILTNENDAQPSGLDGCYA